MAKKRAQIQTRRSQHLSPSTLQGGKRINKKSLPKYASDYQHPVSTNKPDGSGVTLSELDFREQLSWDQSGANVHTQDELDLLPLGCIQEWMRNDKYDKTHIHMQVIINHLTFPERWDWNTKFTLISSTSIKNALVWINMFKQKFFFYFCFDS